jgi:hypothetical protein
MRATPSRATPHPDVTSLLVRPKSMHDIRASRLMRHMFGALMVLSPHENRETTPVHWANLMDKNSCEQRTEVMTGRRNSGSPSRDLHEALQSVVRTD